MLLKLAMWASLDAVEAWNRVAPASDAIRPETALRIPNALAGAATSAAVFGVGQLLFDTPVAMLSSLLWALDVNAIAINRIGKEDTFALFFFLVAVWAYERAKRHGQADPSGAQAGTPRAAPHSGCFSHPNSSRNTWASTRCSTN